MEDELEELKLSAVTEGEEKLNEMMDKKVMKMKRKYEKKISVMRADIVDAAEVMIYFVLTYRTEFFFFSGVLTLY